MGLAGIRRVLLVIVGVLLLLDLGGIVLAKVQAAQPKEEVKAYDLVGKVEKPEEQAKLKKSLEEAGLKVEAPAAPEPGTKDVPNGFSLVHRSTDIKAVEAIEKTLKLRGIKAERIPEGLKYPKLFPKEEQANQAKDKLLKQEGIIFEVVPSTKQVPAKFYRLELKSLSQENADKAETMMKGGGALTFRKEVKPPQEGEPGSST